MTYEAVDDNTVPLHLVEAVTLLQDAAGSGHAVMFPGTRELRSSSELRPMALDVPSLPSAATARHEGATTEGVVSRAFIRGIEWLIARLGGTPRG